MIPIDRRLKFLGLENDCFHHGIWIYDRLYNNEKPVQIAFLGSSGIINGINDELIEEQVGDPQVNIANFGYCRLGRNLQYTLAKDILNTKTIKKLIIEVREDEDRYSHPVFPFLAESQDILLSAPFFNRDIFSDIYHFYMYKLQLIQDVVYRKNVNTPIRHENFGYATSADTANIELLEQYAEKRRKREYKSNSLERNFYMKYPRAYLKKIYHLCRENNVELTFLFMHGFGSDLKRPKEFETYTNYGKLLIPPPDIFENTDFWYDESHFNQAGAAALSSWIAQQIKD